MLLAEIKGSEVMNFSDYMERLAEKNGSVATSLSKIGAALFKAGFTYEDTVFHKLPEDGGCYEVYFPRFDMHNLDMIRCHYFDFRDGVKFTYNRTISTHEIELWTVPTLLTFMKEAARPRST